MLCLQMTTDTSKISKKVKPNNTFIFSVLSETVNGFLQFCLVFETQILLVSFKHIYSEKMAV